MSEVKLKKSGSLELITGKGNIWEMLTFAATDCTNKSFVAVAYFSKNAAAMLPLTKGSILVVDANKNTVKAGQTCPNELLTLLRMGVKIFSFTGLHAKVFVLNNEVYVGSTNVSAHSANYLEEAVFKTNDKGIVKKSIAFIKSLLIKQLNESELEQLQKWYKSPKFFSPKADDSKSIIQNSHDELVYVVKLTILKNSYDDNVDFIKGTKKASQLIKKEVGKNIEWYRANVNHKPKAGNIVIRITTDEGGVTVSPPATILNVQFIKNTKSAFFYVAAYDVKDKKLSLVDRKLKTTELKKAGLKDSSLAARLNSIWI